MEVHNRLHHYSTFGHKTPLELDAELNLPILPLNEDYQVNECPILDNRNRNEIQFRRLVRSDLIINVLNTDIKVDEKLMHTYVEACLLINEHRLLIRQNGRTVQEVEFVMPLD